MSVRSSKIAPNVKRTPLTSKKGSVSPVLVSMLVAKIAQVKIYVLVVFPMHITLLITSVVFVIQPSITAKHAPTKHIAFPAIQTIIFLNRVSVCYVTLH
jgi:hypothetical protein